MLKVLALAALVAAAAAAPSAGDMKAVADGKAAVASVDATLDTLVGYEEAMIKAVAQTTEAVQNVDELVIDVASMAQTSSGVESGAEAANAMFNKDADMQLNIAHEAKMNKIEMELYDIESQLEAAIASAKADTGRIDAVTAGNDALTSVSKDLAARVAKHKKCAETKLLFNAETGKCVGASLPFKSTLPKVAHRMFNNDDGRDGGYINNREVTFVKENDATFIRVYYHDNMRVHGHTSHGRWNVMICDSNGNGCDHCKNPGKLQYWRYASHQHNWWMNDHWGGALTGLCIQSGNRSLKKGKYKLRVMLDSVRYSMYTGHNQHSSFMVDEVFKY